MRPVCFAAILLAAIAATAEAHATIIRITVSGTETFTFQPLPFGDTITIAPPLTLTGTGYLDIEDLYTDLVFTTNAYIQGLWQTQYFEDFDGQASYGGNPEAAATFNYNPNGLSSGTFFLESHDNSGYIDPTGEFFPGRTFMEASGTLTQTVTPEPSTMTLLGTGLLLVAGRLRKRLREESALPASRTSACREVNNLP